MHDRNVGRSARLTAALHEDRHVWLVAIVFFALGAVWLGSVAHYHGDERYYTDAALRMIARHDPWTPVYASGAARLNKPLATYWVVMSTFMTAGVSLFLARIPFLVAGALVVWLTGRLSRVLFPNERAVALLAACIAASDVEIVTLARRSTPDILLVLCATATLYGLARIVIARESGASPRAWLWIGAGGAIATKGGLGLVVIAFAFAAAFLLRRRDEGGVRVRDLVSPAAVAIGVAIALAGLLPGFLAHAPAAGPTLIEDQVSARIVDSPAAALAQAGNYIVSLIRHFAPWLALLLIAVFVARPALRDRWKQHERAFKLGLAWTAVLLVVFSLANTHRGRYLVPAHPILACVCAAWLFDAARANAVRRTARGLTIAMALVAVITALVLVRVDVAVALSLAVVAAAAWVGWNIEHDAARDLRALAFAILAASAVAAEAVRAFVDPSPVGATCAQILAAHPMPKHVATAGFFESTASQMRVVSGARLDPDVLPADAKRAELGLFDAVLATNALRNDLEQAGFTLEEIGRIEPDLDLKSAWSWLTSADPRAWIAHRGEPVLLGLKKSRR